eukprot:CAMPEP_0183415772 /NCGR_PEP_ID=MMETSP0370-20130417/23329_1 /TAXON_ID=268820 /ORGANISM="Peridinium aciculiferum, Strain PAER-2" /LENGTH=97 /DNA_ID=CAMNT_0025599233 /DNA_START=178 /DNA_END=471 /DNA_ORIENTATION=-
MFRADSGSRCETLRFAVRSAPMPRAGLRPDAPSHALRLTGFDGAACALVGLDQARPGGCTASVLSKGLMKSNSKSSIALATTLLAVCLSGGGSNERQ